MARTREWDEAIRTDEQYGDVRVLVVEPGDCTRYELMIVELTNRVCELMHLPKGSFIVSNSNLSGMFTSMPFHMGQYLSWNHVRNYLHISAPGSCWFITELLAEQYGTSCQSYEAFEASLQRSQP